MITLANMVTLYNQQASKLLKLTDSYTAYCMDQAMAEFIWNIKNNKKPRFKTESKKGENTGLKMLLGKKD